MKEAVVYIVCAFIIVAAVHLGIDVVNSNMRFIAKFATICFISVGAAHSVIQWWCSIR